MSLESIADKCLEVTLNIQKVYEAGAREGAGRYALMLNDVYITRAGLQNHAESNGISLEQLRFADIPNATSIADGAFAGLQDLSIVTPLYRLNGIKTIRSSAFEGCVSLKMADLRNCELIERSAFKNCSKLKAVHLKDGVKIEYHAFKNIGSSAYVGFKLNEFTSTNYLCLTTAEGKPILLHSLYIDDDYPGLRFFTVPETVTYIETGFCTNPDALSGLNMPEHHCFQEAHFLKGASHLTTLRLYDLITYDSDDVEGNYVKSLGELFTEETVTSSNLVNFNKTHVPSSLKELTIGGGNINSNCLRGAPFKKLSVGTHFKCTLGANVTRDCASLEEFNIGKYVTSISTGIFNRCTSLSKVTIDPENPKYYYSENDHGIIEKRTNVLNAAFVPAGTHSLVLGTDCKTVKKLSVQGIPHLISLTVNSNIEHIDDWFLDDCINLEDIYADTDYYKTYSVKNPGRGYVWSGALYGKNANDKKDEFTHLLLMPKLLSRILSNTYDFKCYVRMGTKTIAACAFKGCQTQGVTFVIPNSVDTIASNAFQDLHDCTIQFKGNYENIDGYVTRWGAKDTVTFENI